MKPSSIFMKVIMAITGLLWLGFVISHLSANLVMYAGPTTFNAYPEMLRKFGVLLWVAEAGLVVLLASHVFSAIRLTSLNKSARPREYEAKATQGKATFASRSMIVGGLILLIFLVTHIWMFKFGDWSGEHGLWGLVMRTFENPLMVAWYVLAMLALGLHLSHGFGSAFQTLGIFKPAWRKLLWRVGAGVGWLIAVGFATIPIWAFMSKGS